MEHQNLEEALKLKDDEHEAQVIWSHKVFTLMVGWFCCCNSEGPSSLWLACCGVVFALSIPVTGERFRHAQITTFCWPKQLNFHLWCLIWSASSLYSLFFLHTEMCIG